MFAIMLSLSAYSSQGQQLQITVHDPKAPKIVKPDTCLGISRDGIKIYRGSRGGLYWIDARGKKHYLKK